MSYREEPLQYFALVARKAFGYYPGSLGYVECRKNQSGPILLELNQPYYFEGNTMTPNEYQVLAARTECDQEAASRRRYQYDQSQSLLATRLSHAALGLAGESGEFAYAVEKWLHYGKPLDTINIQEEIGDVTWYLALACNALGVNLEDIMQKNIAKLKSRYPEKYSDSLAAEEGRNRERERQVIMGGGYAETDAFTTLTVAVVPTTPVATSGDYGRKCTECGKGIHRTNSVGVCPDCYSRSKSAVE